MSLNFAAVVPHTPLLIPAIGKEKIEHLQSTVTALRQLEQDMYLAKPDLVLIISPHGSLFDTAFTLNAHTQYTSGFDEFGDFETKRTWKGTPDFAAKISHESHVKSLNVRLVSNEKLDHGASVPLFYLTEHLPNIKVLPVGFSKSSAEEHLLFGELLKDIIMSEDKRIAVIASGDMSHRLTPESPDGFHPDGERFNELLLKHIEHHDVSSIVGMDKVLVDNASACIYRSILILLGIIDHMGYSFNKYSYESPFGVGYLTGNFVL